MAFPDVVDLLQAYVAPTVAPVAAVTRVPKPRPAKLVQIRRVGGVARPPVRDQARVDVICWAASEPEAMGLALSIRQSIWALPGTTLLGGVVVYEVAEFMGPRQDDDPLTGTPRVWATYQLSIRADNAIHTAPPP